MDPLGMKICGNSILVPGCGGRHCSERGLGGKFVECCMWEGNLFSLPFTVPTKISTLWCTDTCKHMQTASCLELNMFNIMHSTETIVCGSSEARTPSHPHHPPGCCGFGMNRFSRGCRNAKGPTGILYNMQIFQGTFNPSPFFPPTYFQCL